MDSALRCKRDFKKCPQTCEIHETCGGFRQCLEHRRTCRRQYTGQNESVVESSSETRYFVYFTGLFTFLRGLILVASGLSGSKNIEDGWVWGCSATVGGATEDGSDIVVSKKLVGIVSEDKLGGNTGLAIGND